MKNVNYKDVWRSITSENHSELALNEIDSLLTKQSREVGTEYNRYLRFDLILKAISLIALLVAVILFSSTQFVYALVIAATIGLIALIYQLGMLNKTEIVNYDQPTRVLVSTILVRQRTKVKRLATITSLTNPLLILAGSYLYFFYKYGTALVQDTADIAVTGILMLIGFLFNYTAISVQQNSQLNDLEISNHVLITEDNTGLEKVALRRKRRLVIRITLISVGLALFLWLLSGYLLAA